MTRQEQRRANALARELWRCGHKYEAYKILREVIKDAQRDTNTEKKAA